MRYELVYDNYEDPGDVYGLRTSSLQKAISLMNSPKSVTVTDFPGMPPFEAFWCRDFWPPYALDEIDEEGEQIRRIWTSRHGWKNTLLTSAEKRTVQGTPGARVLHGRLYPIRREKYKAAADKRGIPLEDWAQSITLLEEVY
jgi:hypothetical protein